MKTTFQTECDNLLVRIRQVGKGIDKIMTSTAYLKNRAEAAAEKKREAERVRKELADMHARITHS